MLEASGRVVDPAAIKNGSLLLSLAEEHIKGYWTLFPDQEFGPQLTSTDCKMEELSLSWGSCCSGSEGAFYVFEALNSVFESHDVRLSLRHKFSCESHQDKQKWIQAVVKCGFLVDLSSKCLEMSTSKGGSAQTYHGFISYVQAMPPLFVFYENVDAIEDAIGPQAVSNMDILLNQMSELGYASQKMMTDAKEFRLPARRRRSYVLFVRQTNPYLDFSKQGLHDALATFRLMVASCLRSAPCVSEVLLDNADDDEVFWCASIPPHPQILADLEVLLGPLVAALRIWGLGCPLCCCGFLGQEALLLQGFPVRPFLAAHEKLRKNEAASTQSNQPLAGSTKKRKREEKEKTIQLDISESLMQDLAGNAMALPVVLGIVQSALCCFKWKPLVEPATEEQLDLAMGALGILASLQGKSGK
ncbi:Uncharacterized protein SCF082_LOCUS48281 [Durusdinium trenchii]|uniref:Uncharacterized protein n=1 Tax=Durusdinium trenchii TaxID=1381693 RepID=A0ABP0RVU8_9DINO